ncbi:MAG: hypothetical protein AUI36_24890 [Cyanobacteria bacterium 13_1_40CM_2_61_4]|nr:MAG: hypothetical protein AUI36_24890 [Cyanobacteria bacterium 13_1_40CM_2_61_4]
MVSKCYHAIGQKGQSLLEMAPDWTCLQGFRQALAPEFVPEAGKTFAITGVTKNGSGVTY